MNIFEKMLDQKTRKAFIEYRSKRRIPDYLMKAMEDYLLSDGYEKDVKRLMQGDYHLSIPQKKTIPKRYTNRKRIVYHFEENEMNLFRMISYVLHDYDSLISNDVYSFKKGISAKNFIHKIRSSHELWDMYVAKTDITSYGNSIDADILIQDLSHALGKQEPELVAFFSWMLKRRLYIEDGQLKEGDTSALPGCPIHNFFTNLYLTEADHLLSPQCHAYARYSDDIIMYVPTYNQARHNMDQLMDVLKRRKLTAHGEDKTMICEPGQYYEYLGISFCNGDIDIAKSSIKKLKRKMRIRAKRIGRDKKNHYKSPEDKAMHLIYLNKGTFFGRPESTDLSWTQWAFPVINKTDGIHELDLYNQHCIRYVLTGKWSDCQYRVSYEELKQLGYESLVRAYYNQE